jgi:hypothetical protein
MKYLYKYPQAAYPYDDIVKTNGSRGRQEPRRLGRPATLDELPDDDLDRWAALGFGFFHQGQLEGRRERISPHLVRGPEEPVDAELQAFYERLLAVVRQPVVRDGRFAFSLAST